MLALPEQLNIHILMHFAIHHLVVNAGAPANALFFPVHRAVHFQQEIRFVRQRRNGAAVQLLFAVIRRNQHRYSAVVLHLQLTIRALARRFLPPIQPHVIARRMESHRDCCVQQRILRQRRRMGRRNLVADHHPQQAHRRIHILRHLRIFHQQRLLTQPRLQVRILGGLILRERHQLPIRIEQIHIRLDGGRFFHRVQQNAQHLHQLLIAEGEVQNVLRRFASFRRIRDTFHPRNLQNLVHARSSLLPVRLEQAIGNVLRLHFARYQRIFRDFRQQCAHVLVLLRNGFADLLGGQLRPGIRIYALGRIPLMQDFRDMPHVLVEIQVHRAAQHITADVDIRTAALHAVIHHRLVIQKQLPRGEPLPIDLQAQGIQQIPIGVFLCLLHFRHERPPVEIAEGNGRQRRLECSFLRQSVQWQHHRQRQQNRKQLLHGVFSPLVVYSSVISPEKRLRTLSGSRDIAFDTPSAIPVI